MAAQPSRLLQDWPTTGASIDSEIYGALSSLRNRSRHLAKNNDYARRFLSMLKTNVIGPTGVKLQARTRNDAGELDKADNDYIESQFKQWARKGSCTVDGKFSFVDCQNLFMETIARDGEFLARKVYPWPGNRFGFALQLIEPEMLDHQLNKTLPNGNKIRLGVEYNKWSRPVAYWLLKESQNQSFWTDVAIMRISERHERIPAEFIIHEFIPLRIGQSRGVPWFHTVGRRLQMLSGYEEAELVAARTAASKMGFFKSETGDMYTGDDDAEGGEDDAPTMVADPGTFEQLPAGLDFVKWDPDHPVAAFEAFVLSILRGVASGLNVSYVNLANDLRSVSYSSIRQGELSDRDAWRMLQGFVTDHFLTDVYERWLKMGILTDALNLPGDKFEKFQSVVWQPRGWKWVDPLKEVNASEKEVRNGFKSPQAIAAENGRDFEDTLREIREAMDLAESLGIPLSFMQSENGGQNVEVESIEDDQD